MAAVAKAVQSMDLWDLHRTLGHIAPEAAKAAVGAVEGINLDESSTIDSCHSCDYAKMTRKPITKTRQTPQASKFGEEVHSDLWGPSPVFSAGKRQYYVSFTDDYS